ncbi:MAG: GNAT family N-acetyltransferase [Desulfobacteraceae bacterium]|jgi:ribosomal protein S18 acetylase RimI-like enzyme
MEIIIRDALPDDLDALVMLLQALFSIEVDFAVDKKRQRRGLSMMLDGCGKHRCVKVAQVEGAVVGMCTAQMLVSTAQGGQVALIEDMVVDSQFRRLGIGRQLLSAIEKWAHNHGMTRMQLLADRTNFSALDFYDKMGWCPTRLICLRRQLKDPGEK